MKKLIHIISDKKFVDHQLMKYEEDLFDNHVILIENKKNDLKNIKYDCNIVKPCELEKIVRLCIKSDLVIIYNLSGFHLEIVKEIVGKVKVAWRFFGTEIYSRNIEKYLTDATKKNIRPSLFNIKYLIPRLAKIRNRKTDDERKKKLDLRKISDQIELFLALSLEEYRYLNSEHFDLPEFLKLPHANIGIQDIDFYRAREMVVLGNNRYPVNNHIDILNLIKGNNAQYKYEMLFNYGPENFYSESVRKAAKSIKDLKVVDEFIPYDRFHTYYCDKAALVINSYRQMAGRNIYMALRCGVKVYMKSTNPFYQFLKNQKFLIFTIEGLKKDLKKGELNLSSDERQYNYNNMDDFSSRYNNREFSESLYSKI